MCIMTRCISLNVRCTLNGCTKQFNHIYTSNSKTSSLGFSNLMVSPTRDDDTLDKDEETHWKSSLKFKPFNLNTRSLEPAICRKRSMFAFSTPMPKKITFLD